MPGPGLSYTCLFLPGPQVHDLLLPDQQASCMQVLSSQDPPIIEGSEKQFPILCINPIMQGVPVLQKSLGGSFKAATQSVPIWTCGQLESWTSLAIKTFQVSLTGRNHDLPTQPNTDKKVQIFPAQALVGK